VISNVALLGRPLLVKIIFCFLSGVGSCFLFLCFAIYGVVFRGEDWSGVLSRTGFFLLYIVLFWLFYGVYGFTVLLE